MLQLTTSKNQGYIYSQAYAKKLAGVYYAKLFALWTTRKDEA
jgi:hypothetical protein